jgi:hypothetical protein
VFGFPFENIYLTAALTLCEAAISKERSMRVYCHTMLTIAVVSFVPASSSAQVCVASPPGLVGWWTGDSDATDTVAGNNGVLLGSTTFAQGIVANGFKMDGVGDGVQIPDTAALKPAAVSVEAWVRFDSLDTPPVSQFFSPGIQYIVFKKNTRTFNFEGYSLHKERHAGGDRIAFRVTNANGFGNIALSTTPVAVGQFYHVVGTYDGTTVKMYVNGVLEGQAAATITMDYGTNPIFIGTSGETVFDGKLNGVVDEASIYNRPLTSTEIADLFAAGGAGKCRSASGLLSRLVAFVQTLNLSAGIANSLDAKLQTILGALDDAGAGDNVSACGKIGAFLNEVNAQEGGRISSAQAEQLRTMAQQVYGAMSCGR